MKNMYLRTCVALACALGLGGCGGDDPDLLLQVRSITNLTKDGLVLKLNGGTERAVPANSTFYNFPELIGRDSSFEITVFKNPPNATCVIFDGKGKTGSIPPQTIRIECTLVTYNLGGTITGLADKEKIKLNNGSITKEFTAVGSAPIIFNMSTGTDANSPGRVPEDFSYGVTVLEKPAGKTCTVSKGTGIMPAREVNDIVVTCA